MTKVTRAPPRREGKAAAYLLPWMLDQERRRWLHGLLILLAAAFLCLYFVHLQADFPNFSPWSDWSKMTDEGWYSSAAIRYFLEGNWFKPESFNPAVAMPLWPLLLGLWFKLTGVSMVAARALVVVLYGISLGLLYLLLRRSAGAIAAAAGVALMAINPFCFAFDRLAVLEPLLVLCMLAGLLLADCTGVRQGRRQLTLGVIIFALVLTKTTGVFLAPAILYHLWAVSGWPRRPILRPIAVIAGTALGLWLAYYLLAIKPYHLEDFRLLFLINHGRVHLSIIPHEAMEVLRDGLWINPILFVSALLCVGWAVSRDRQLLKVPLFGSSIVATVGYLTFIGYHSNLQPRYYLVIAAPVVIVIVLTMAKLWESGLFFAALAGSAFLTLASIGMGVRTIRYVTHPEYSFVSAANDIAAKMRAQQPDGRPVLLSNSGDSISLFTGIPAVPIEYSTAGLDALIDRYHPGWVAVWAGREDHWVAQLSRTYRLEEAAHYVVFDDPTRNHLVLYRLSR